VKSIAIISFFLLIGLNGFGQDTDSTNYIYGAHPEIAPTYPGGNKELLEFFSKNIIYPKEQTAIGKLYISFKVDTLGTAINPTLIKVPKGINVDKLTHEIERVIALMPKWKSGTVNGKKQTIKMILPLEIFLK
jgi:hypothetical protein